MWIKYQANLERAQAINIYVCNHYLLNTNMGTTITTRVPEDLEKKIEEISHIEHLDKSTVVRRLLSNAVQEWMVDYVLMQYQQGKITIGRAARMVGVPLREMIAMASRKGIPFQYSLDDLREDFQAAENL
jgi:predicted HTH domain antitoxin